MVNFAGCESTRKIGGNFCFNFFKVASSLSLFSLSPTIDEWKYLEQILRRLISAFKLNNGQSGDHLQKGHHTAC